MSYRTRPTNPLRDLETGKPPSVIELRNKRREEGYSVLQQDPLIKGCPHTFSFYCPGCEKMHCFKVNPKRPPSCNILWINVALDSPFRPLVSLSGSILVEYSDGRICHIEIKNSQIKYSGDTWHDLKNMEVSMVSLSKVNPLLLNQQT